MVSMIAPDTKDHRGDHEGLPPTKALRYWPYSKACCKCASLLQTDGKRVDSGSIVRLESEVMCERGEGENASC